MPIGFAYVPEGELTGDWVELGRVDNIDGLVQDCGNSSAFAMELLQSCTEPSKQRRLFVHGIRRTLQMDLCHHQPIYIKM